MRILPLILLSVVLAGPLCAKEEAPKPLTWDGEGFAAISAAADTAKAKGKRLLLGLSGGST